MDLLMSEMNKLLVSGRENCDIQDIIGESAGKNIDELLNEADKIIGETLPYFQTTSNSNKVKSSKDVENVIVSPNVKTKISKNQQNETKKVVFNLENNSQSNHVPEKHTKTPGICGKLATNKYIVGEERKINNCSSLKKCTPPEPKVTEVNNAKTNLQVSSSIVENHSRLQNICDKHAKLANNVEAQDGISKLKLEEELNFYKMRNSELENSLLIKEQEIQEWENRYHQLNQYCELFLKKNIEENLKSYDCQINEIIERNMTRESKLHVIINNLLEEIDESHLHYRIKLSEQNKQIRKYLDQIEKILDNVYKFKNNNTKR